MEQRFETILEKIELSFNELNTSVELLKKAEVIANSSVNTTSTLIKEFDTTINIIGKLIKEDFANEYNRMSYLNSKLLDDIKNLNFDNKFRELNITVSKKNFDNNFYEILSEIKAKKFDEDFAKIKSEIEEKNYDDKFQEISQSLSEKQLSLKLNHKFQNVITAINEKNFDMMFIEIEEAIVSKNFNIEFDELKAELTEESLTNKLEKKFKNITEAIQEKNFNTRFNEVKEKIEEKNFDVDFTILKNQQIYLNKLIEDQSKQIKLLKFIIIVNGGLLILGIVAYLFLNNIL